MDWSTVSPIGPIKQRLEWLAQRQQVLAGNIANADTPGYVPRDLRPLAFADVVRRETQVRLAATDARHLAGAPQNHRQFAIGEQRETAEVTPAGNAVDLEEQMAKVNETAVSHKLTTQLYRKYLGLMRMAASVRG
jgi:flagellar basal-body rod protein FlgB